MKCGRTERGLTLAELIVAFVLVLLLLLYTISSFVSSHRYIVRGKEYSTALFLAQTKMEVLHATPISDVVPGQGKFEPPFENYIYDVALTAWDGDLKQLDVNVTSPRGAIARIKTLRELQTFQGVVADPATNRVVFTNGANQLLSVTDTPGINGGLLTPTNLGPPASGAIGALAGEPGWGFLFAVNSDQHTLLPYREQNPQPWGNPVGFPRDIKGLASTRLAGAAMDRMGNVLYVTDSSNRGLWVYNDGIPGIAKGLYKNRLFAPVQPPLGIPSGVATDDTGSLVVVADTENQCIRKLFVNLSDPTRVPPGYNPQDLEYAEGLGYWLKERLRFPEQGMGAPQGLALNTSGWAVYMIDRAYLYRMIEQTPGDYEWKRWELPAELARAGPSGLTYDEYDNVVYVVSKEGDLWKHKVAAEWKKLVSGTATP